jgi:hypothetical protein
MQDLYYNCVSCRSVLNIVGFDHRAFQYFRKLDYRGALPRALEILSRIVATAHDRGAVPVILNVPSMNWKGELQHPGAHPYSWYYQRIAKWAGKNGVPYADAVSAFMGSKALDYVISNHDRHLNDAGHARVATTLVTLLERSGSDLASCVYE